MWWNTRLASTSSSMSWACFVNMIRCWSHVSKYLPNTLLAWRTDRAFTLRAMRLASKVTERSIMNARPISLSSDRRLFLDTKAACMLSLLLASNACSHV
jgi:hypothetical protein